MTQLSACYFCGTALDDPVEDYPVVPDSLRADAADPTTVTLCPSCHEKLDAVVAEVGDALRTETTTESPAVEAPDDTDDLLVDPDEGSDAATGDDGPATDATAPHGTDADGRADSDPRQADDTESSPESMGRSDADGMDAPSHDDTGANEGEPDDADDTERSVVEGKHDISALEYNKVMRLLQNREFPVDREEIEIVAANAYQVARSDCATVIDVAVDRGLIVEEDGKLLKSETV